MKYYYVLLASLLLLTSCSQEAKEITASSPDNNIQITFNLTDKGEPYYKVSYKNNAVIDSSGMSFDFKEQASLKADFKIVKTETNTVDET